jgi:WD40 repeat protein
MSDTRTPNASVVERTRPVAAGAAIVAIHFLRDTAVFVLSEETLLLVGKDGAEKRAEAHGGAILAAASDGDFVITGGDDGKVMVTNAQGEAGQAATDPKPRWIDRVAAGPDNAIAWSAGKQAFVKTAKGEERAVDLPSSVGGLAFAPKGFRVAIAHYGGASLWFPNARDAKPEFLEWKGSHLDVSFSPDGRFLVTSMQEPMLHGWRVVDAKHMRMSGYAARVRSMSWTADGKALATSGSNQLIIWPFQSKDGPMGKTPQMLAPYEHNACAVACHPKQDVIAVGYEDGLMLLVRMPDGAEILAKRPGNAPVTALAWNAAGNLVAFGTEDGEAGIISLG